MENLKLLGILVILLILIKPNIGVDFELQQKNIPVPLYDLPASTLGERSVDTGKMKLALDYPRKARVKKVVPKINTEVASITHYKFSVPAADLNGLIDTYAAQYNANPTIMKVIAQCESGFRAEATNGNFGGMYQFLASTWSSNRKAMGLDPDPNLRFVAEEAIKTAAFKMGRDGYGAWPECYRKALASAN